MEPPETTGTEASTSRLADQLIAIMDGECDIDVEIDQTKYPRPDWAVDQIVRASGLVEDICKHGTGHPNADWMKIHDPDGELGFGIHGCCQNMCCFDESVKKRLRAELKTHYQDNE